MLSYIENITPSRFHAAPSILNRVDRSQHRVLRKLGFSKVEALELYRLAPLPCRREMAMMGALHIITVGIAPQQLAAFFLVVGVVHEPLLARLLRGWSTLQQRQVSTPDSFMFSKVMLLNNMI